VDDRHDTLGALGTVVHPACLQSLDGSHRPGGQEPVTRQEIEAILAAMDAMNQRWGEQLGAMDIRLVEMDKRWPVEGGELREALLGALERRLNDAVTRQTRSLAITLMVSVVAIAGSQGQQHLVPVAA